jgi:hypothetical protein
MTSDTIAVRVKTLREHRAKLADELRKLEAAILVTDGQIKETEQYWATQVRISQYPVPAHDPEPSAEAAQ